MIRPLLRPAALLLAAIPLPALAQAYQCTPPNPIGAIPTVEPDGPTRRLPIAGYTLAASWSPEYCKSSRDRAGMQCSGRNGRFGFVLHGLWPESRGPAWPQWCATGPLPSPALIRENLCMTPSPSLLAHEWLKHGTCMARRPADYYRQAAELWRGLRWPDADRLSRKPGLTAGDLRTSLIEANPGWRREQIGLLVSRTGWLEEVHLCLGRGFKPVTCARTVRGPADAAPLKIWRGL